MSNVIRAPSSLSVRLTPSPNLGRFAHLDRPDVDARGGVPLPPRGPTLVIFAADRRLLLPVGTRPARALVAAALAALGLGASLRRR